MATLQYILHFKLDMPSGTTSMKVKSILGAQVNTIPLNKFKRVDHHMLGSQGKPKKVITPIEKTWISHEGLPKQFLGQFLLNIYHVPKTHSYLTCFYTITDTMSPHSSVIFCMSLIKDKIIRTQ